MKKDFLERADIVVGMNLNIKSCLLEESVSTFSPDSLSNKKNIKVLALTEKPSMSGQVTDVLRQSEERYRLLVEHSPYCIHEIDPKGRLSSMNKAGLDMMGVSNAGEIKGLPYLEVVCPRDRKRVGKLLIKARNGASSIFEFESLNERIYQSCFVPMMENPKEVSIMGLTMDITDQTLQKKQLERYLIEDRALSTLLRLSLEITPLHYYLQQFIELLINPSSELNLLTEGAVYLLDNEQYYDSNTQVANVNMPIEKSSGDDLFSWLTTEALENNRLFCLPNIKIEADLKNVCCAPIMNKEKVLGVLLFGMSKEHLFKLGDADFIGRVTDVISLGVLHRKAEERLAAQALHDELTGLANRRLLQDRCEQKIIEAKRNKKFGALLFIDLDQFKTINDVLGHAYGDIILKNVAQRLNKNMRENDTVARLGGDEFVVLLNDLGNTESAAKLNALTKAENIIKQLSKAHAIVGQLHYVTPSIGINLYPRKGEDFNELLMHADAAMYVAKAEGRNTVRVFHADMHTKLNHRLMLQNELPQALKEEQFVLYYQAQFTPNQKIVGAEALIRWKKPKEGLITPIHFISVAEDMGLIISMGKWVIKQVCEQLVKWIDSPTIEPPEYVSINVSSKQLRENNFVQSSIDIITASGVPPSRIVFEITEGAVISNIDDAVEKMIKLREYGIRFSLDDFGTGYSSLSYLSKLPLDELKIDQSFVSEILSDTNSTAIIESIIAMAKHFNLQVVAEGVENEKQMHYLIQSGCDILQGYYLGRPIDNDAFEAFLLKITN